MPDVFDECHLHVRVSLQVTCCLIAAQSRVRQCMASIVTSDYQLPRRPLAELSTLDLFSVIISVYHWQLSPVAIAFELFGAAPGLDLVFRHPRSATGRAAGRSIKGTMS